MFKHLFYSGDIHLFLTLYIVILLASLSLSFRLSIVSISIYFRRQMLELIAFDLTWTEFSHYACLTDTSDVIDDKL